METLDASGVDKADGVHLNAIFGYDTKDYTE